MLNNIVLIITTLSTILLAIVVLINNPKKTSNRSFFYFGVSLGLWSLTNLLANLSAIPDNALFYSRLAIVPAAFIGYTFLLFSFSFSSLKSFKLSFRILLLLPSILITSLSMTDYNVASSNEYATKVEIGPLYIFLLVYLVSYISWGLINLIHSLKNSRGLKREQVKYVLVSILLIAIPGLLLSGLLPIVGVSEYSAIGPMFAIIMVTIMSYAIMKKKLMDIRATAARYTAYVLSIVFVAAIYAFVAFFIVDTLLPKDTSELVFQASYITIAVIMAFSFGPIKGFFEKLSNKLFFRSKYDPQELINEIGRVLASEIKVAEITKKTTHTIRHIVKCLSADIYIVDNVAITPLLRTKETQLAQLKKDMHTLGGRPSFYDFTNDNHKKRVFEKYGFSASFPIKTNGRIIGYLLLGDKKNGSIYNEEDIRALKIIANELGIAIQNAKSFDQIQKFNITLQDKVDVATSNLRKANSKLKELDEAKDEFISMASHQLRTPLTTVKGYVSMLYDGDFGNLDKEQLDVIKLALESSNKMAGLIDDLLNVSRIEAGKFFIDSSEVNLKELVVQEVEQLKSLAISKNVELNLNVEDSYDYQMLLDKNKIMQSIMNITDNAINYSEPPKGGGRVDVWLGIEDGEVVFKVQDNGIGIPKDQQGELFRKMFRAKNAKEVRPDGTGLGLFLVKRVVEDHGGKVFFKSEPGKGSTFGFKLPKKGIPNSLKIKSEELSKKVKLTV